MSSPVFIIDFQAPDIPVITGGDLYSATITARPGYNISNASQIALTGTRADDTRCVVRVRPFIIAPSVNRTISVGAAGDYRTVGEAHDAAQDGDLILIEPGTYRENVLLNKWVHFKGNTTNPDSVKIISPAPLNPSLTVDISYDNPLDIPVYLEGLRIGPD